jgi:hypothetical protein
MLDAWTQIYHAIPKSMESLPPHLYGHVQTLQYEAGILITRGLTSAE